MTPLTLQLLLALAANDATSAELFRQVREDDRDHLVVRERSFYAALARLEKEGKIKRDIDAHKQIRYQLTPFGRRLLKAEHERLKHAVMLLRDRL